MAKRVSVTIPVQSCRRVEFHPPASNIISAYAQQVCRSLGAKIDTTYDTSENARELANFLGLAARVYAKYLNHRQAVETGEATAPSCPKIR